jgi:trimethylamine--corrinoid protein Co-methyltransferase
MASGMICSLEQLIMGNEIIGMTKRFVEGIAVTKETLARQIIEDVGPGGHFITRKHTLDHFRQELSVSRLLDRQTIDSWKNVGQPTMDQRVKDEIRSIMETHRPDPLSDKVTAEIERLAQEGEKEIRARQPA